MCSNDLFHLFDMEIILTDANKKRTIAHDVVRPNVDSFTTNLKTQPAKTIGSTLSHQQVRVPINLIQVGFIVKCFSTDS